MPCTHNVLKVCSHTSLIHSTDKAPGLGAGRGEGVLFYLTGNLWPVHGKTQHILCRLCFAQSSPKCQVKKDNVHYRKH